MDKMSELLAQRHVSLHLQWNGTIENDFYILSKAKYLVCGVSTFCEAAQMANVNYACPRMREHTIARVCPFHRTDFQQITTHANLSVDRYIDYIIHH